METTSSFVAVTPVQHNGKLYKPGASIELTEAQAELLLDLKAVKIPSADAPAAAPVVLAKKTLGKLTVEELTAYAAAMNVVLPAGATKETILETIGGSEPAPAGA